MDPKIYIGDIGLVILIDMGEDISTATEITLDVLPPKAKVKSNGTVIGGKEWIPEIIGTNFLQYLTQENDLDQVGIYRINPKLTLGDWTGHGNTVEFEVLNKGE